MYLDVWTDLEQLELFGRYCHLFWTLIWNYFFCFFIFGQFGRKKSIKKRL